MLFESKMGIRTRGNETVTFLERLWNTINDWVEEGLEQEDLTDEQKQYLFEQEWMRGFQ